jgi:4-aminobutyrate aminotransferase-like enzyme
LVCADYVGEVIKAESPGNVAAVILEPWARVGGTPKGYLPRVKKICEENGALLIADEITCGCGRSGKWWYCNYEGVVPDILITGKGIGSGIVPVSFVVTTKEIADGLPYSINEGQTFGAVPAACAAVSATIDVIKELKLVENAASVGDYMKKRLQEMTNEHKLLGDVSAAGLEITLDIVKNKETKEPVFAEGVELGTKLWEKGLLTYGPWFFWTPPLVLTRQQAEKGLDIFEEALSEVERQ